MKSSGWLIDRLAARQKLREERERQRRAAVAKRMLDELDRRHEHAERLRVRWENRAGDEHPGFIKDFDAPQCQ